MKLFHLIFVYIMLGSPGPVNKGLSSCQSGYVCVCGGGGGGDCPWKKGGFSPHFGYHSIKSVVRKVL